LEVTHQSVLELHPDEKNRIFHTNHMLLKHPGTSENWLGDTVDRLQRVKDLANDLGDTPSLHQVGRLMQDEDNWPCSINRSQTGASDAATVFTIVSDVTKARAVVTIGRPNIAEETLVLDPRSWVGGSSRL
jgi:isopenicillin-N N-acyltransferase-like protein